MPIQKATEALIPQIDRLYTQARAFLKAQGLDQWQDGTPNAETARADILRGDCYVLKEAGAVLGTACLMLGREPTYEKIFEGSWGEDPPRYAFLHRIAVAPEARGRGAARLFFEELERMARAEGLTVLRGDTHRGNCPMQRVMEKCGLAYRGVIYLEDGAERLAYEKLLTPFDS